MDYLQKYHFSVIPLKKDKRPLIKWEEYQKRLPTEEEVRLWWSKYPSANIGIVTGKLSGIAVIDIDSKAPDFWCDAPHVNTPRGYHCYYKYQDGITNTVNVSGQKQDIRGEGGYVVAPPSVSDNGEKYKWARSLSRGLPEFPMKILPKPGERFESKENISERLTQGRRDEDLFHVAHLLIKSNASEHLVKDVIMKLASTCDPPFPNDEAVTKVESAVKRAIRKERPLSKEVEDWVRESKGWFNARQLYGDLGLTQEEQTNVRVILSRLGKKGVVARHKTKHGYYRQIEVECLPIDWQNAPTKDVPMEFPLGIHDMLNIYPGNVIIVAGESNAGKTAFLLDFIRLNMGSYDIHYFNSEMGATELKIRLGLFLGVGHWRFTAWERSDNFSDVIRPDSINVIDFLDITDDFWQVGGVIKDVHAKLNDGIAIIALQKNRGRDTGRGGELSLEKPRLYLAMGRGEMKIVKAKNWKGSVNPNRKIQEFKLYKGSHFESVGYWHYPLDKKT